MVEDRKLRNVVVHRGTRKAPPAAMPPKTWPAYQPPRLPSERRRFVEETGRAVAGLFD